MKKIKVSILSGGDDPTYALPLTSALISRGITIDFIGNDSMKNTDIWKNTNVNYLNLRGDQNENVPLKDKVIRILRYYLNLIKYTALTDSKIFHILWLNKFIYFDRTLLNIYYKVLGKKLVFTAHNINDGERDERDTLVNRLTLKFLYRIVDHIFVHTNKMKQQLVIEYGVREEKVTVIPFGINNVVPKTDIVRFQARKRLNLEHREKVLLFFGQIAPYKGLKYLILALAKLKEKHEDLKLIIAGRVKRGYNEYWEDIDKIIENHHLNDFILKKIEFITDDDIEVYFKSADVLILPYKKIFQTGVFSLAYNFGLPIIAANVGSLKEDIIEGRTGLICKPEDPDDLAKKIVHYFNSDLYKNLDENRGKIIEFAKEKYSWDKVGEKTHNVYNNILN